MKNYYGRKPLIASTVKITPSFPIEKLKQPIPLDTANHQAIDVKKRLRNIRKKLVTPSIRRSLTAKLNNIKTLDWNKNQEHVSGNAMPDDQIRPGSK